jgi:hypothetical protein
MPRRRLAEPTVVLLAAGAFFIVLLCIMAIAHTDAIWLILLTVAAITLIAVAIILDLRRVIGDDDAAPVSTAPQPGRAILVSTAPMTASEVLEALDPLEGEARSIMVVCPEGHDGYERAHRVEASTVEALRRSGINAAGQVGDRNPGHAIENALALFPARKVVVVTQAEEADVYREHVDPDALRRSTGAVLRFIPKR